jgi:hypothetical protein
MIARNQRSSRSVSWQEAELEADWFSSKELILYVISRESDFPAKRTFYCNAMKSKDKELSGPTDMGHKHLVVEPGALQIFL